MWDLVGNREDRFSHNEAHYYLFQLQIESKQGRGDDTSLNGVQLICGSKSGVADGSFASSISGIWGDWKGEVRCLPGQVIAGFKLQVEKRQVKSLFRLFKRYFFHCCYYVGPSARFGDYKCAWSV